MTEVLVDTSVILDVLTEDPIWFDWSASMLSQFSDQGDLVINQVIFAEISRYFPSFEDAEAILLTPEYFRLDELPYDSVLVGWQAYKIYQRHGGKGQDYLPFFYIGAHAVIQKLPLLTRDSDRYRTYFPQAILITPNSERIEA
ncbi:hypothetical protein LEP3755_01420 [Leptolyngbya sp. NIES-3755]|nr:hypothetical protein LEP3755_01420 [Leptolyngbya sp. NIES-3755]